MTTLETVDWFDREVAEETARLRGQRAPDGADLRLWYATQAETLLSRLGFIRIGMFGRGGAGQGTQWQAHYRHPDGTQAALHINHNGPSLLFKVPQ